MQFHSLMKSRACSVRPTFCNLWKRPACHTVSRTFFTSRSASYTFFCLCNWEMVPQLCYRSEAHSHLSYHCETHSQLCYGSEAHSYIHNECEGSSSGGYETTSYTVKREGRDYSAYLAQKTMDKRIRISSKKAHPKCHRTLPD